MVNNSCHSSNCMVSSGIFIHIHFQSVFVHKNLSCSVVNPYGSFKNENMNYEDLMEDLCLPYLVFLSSNINS